MDSPFDSYDYWVWASLKNYCPKVVIIEVNSCYRPTAEHVQPPDLPVASVLDTGASFRPTVRLGWTKGYSPVCHTGNLIFVRNDLVPMLGLPQEDLLRPERLFDRKSRPSRVVLWRARRRLRPLRAFLTRGKSNSKHFSR
jgi:hypothetical protein